MNRPAAQDTWHDFLSHPSDEWKNQKCTLYVHFMASIVVYLAQEDNCPINSWLAVYFMIMVLDVLRNEFIRRISNSMYWAERRRQRKMITYGVGLGKELIEMVWVIHGIGLDCSKCNDDTYGLSIIMNLFITRRAWLEQSLMMTLDLQLHSVVMV